MVAVTTSVAYKNAALNAALALVDSGFLDLRTGSAPASPSDAVTGTRLALLSLAADAFPNASGGVATAGTIADVLASATGDAGYGRLLATDGTTGHMDIPAGGSFVTTAAANVLTTNVAHSLSNTDPVEVFAEAGGAVPSPLAENVVYYARSVTSTTLELAATSGGGAITLGNTGTAVWRLKRATVGLVLASATGHVDAGVTVGVASLKVRM